MTPPTWAVMSNTSTLKDMRLYHRINRSLSRARLVPRTTVSSNGIPLIDGRIFSDTDDGSAAALRPDQS